MGGGSPTHCYVSSPPPSQSSENIISYDNPDIQQYDGNVSISSNLSEPTASSPCINHHPVNNKKMDKISAALSLPIVATYNLRSLFPKIENLTTDMLERSVDVGFLTEIWENTFNLEHNAEIEKMLEISGLKYISTARPPNAKGVCYGGAAIEVNLRKFSVEKLSVQIPNNLEIVWGLLKPKSPSSKFKKIIDQFGQSG